MACWGAASVVSKGAGRKPGGAGGVVALRRGRGDHMSFRAIPGSHSRHPLPPAPRPPPGGQGSRTRNGLIRGFSRFSVHTVLVPTGGRRGADNAARGTMRRHHARGRSLSARCPWREVRYGFGSQFRCVSILSSASPMGADLAKRISSSLNFSAVQRRGKECGCPKQKPLRVPRVHPRPSWTQRLACPGSP